LKSARLHEGSDRPRVFDEGQQLRDADADVDAFEAKLDVRPPSEYCAYSSAHNSGVTNQAPPLTSPLPDRAVQSYRFA
jgi:hypothetical protein